MAIDDYDFTPEDVKSRLHEQFEAAKATDEFEFGCTLLRVRGMESAGWDPFGETHQLVEDLMTLIGGPLVPHTKVRLGLLLYSHGVGSVPPGKFELGDPLVGFEIKRARGVVAGGQRRTPENFVAIKQLRKNESDRGGVYHVAYATQLPSG